MGYMSRVSELTIQLYRHLRNSMLLQTPASIDHLDLLRGLINMDVELCETDPAIESTWLFRNVIEQSLDAGFPAFG